MCDECDKIDAKIAHYRKLVDPAMDALTRGFVATAIEDLKAEKAKLHPDKGK
jgi:hypothetical protein